MILLSNYVYLNTLIPLVHQPKLIQNLLRLIAGSYTRTNHIKVHIAKYNQSFSRCTNWLRRIRIHRLITIQWWTSACWSVPRYSNSSTSSNSGYSSLRRSSRSSTSTSGCWSQGRQTIQSSSAAMPCRTQSCST